jgi:lysophospholipase L1-like esterase
MANLVFLGDSLTEWFDWQRRFPDHRVTNLGISGEPVEGLLDRRGRIRASIADPDFIFLMTGINNLATGQYDIIVPYREIVRNLTTWYKKTILVIQSILPADLTWIDNAVIQDTNRQLKELAGNLGTEYLDIYSLFVDSKGHPYRGFLSDDGVHLASKGYDVWSNEVDRFVKKHPLSS